MSVFRKQIKHKMAICPFILRNVSGRPAQYPQLYENTSHFSSKYRLQVVFMVSFWFALVHKIISMACIVYSPKCKNNRDCSELHNTYSQLPL
jgi:hypothetical protein